MTIRKLKNVSNTKILKIEQAFESDEEDGPGKKLTIQEVAQITALAEDVVRRKLSFWIVKGLVREVEPGVYQVQEEVCFH